MRHGDRPAHPRLQLARQRLRRVPRGALAGHDHRVRPLQRVPSLAPGAGRQRPAHRPGRLSAHHEDVEIAMHVEALVRVVEHQHLGAVGERALRARHAVGIGDHHGLRHRMLVHQRLVVAVAAKQDPGPQAALDVVPGDPDSDRRLARSTHRQVAHGDRRQREVSHRDPAPAVGHPPGVHGETPESRDRQQRQPRQAGVGPAAGPQPTHHPVGVASAAHPSLPAISRSRSSASASPAVSPASPSATSNGRP